MSQVITNAFEQYWQSSLAAEQPVVLDEFILADIPNLDITSPIDPDTGLPPESQIVHRQNVDQRGRINNNAVAYTIVMDTTVGDFSFNAMYLRNKQNGVIGMIVYKGRETKLKTDQTTGQTGNSLVKSMLMGYDQAAEATLTHVDAGTWQIDYAARLRGQDEDLRQLASQLYGHHTFIGDGFKVVQQDGGHQVTQGVAIVGGLRIELKQPEAIHPGTKPIGVWVDVHRSGSLLSEHQNHFTIITSLADLTDHVDGSGYQHYVAKLGTVQADSTVIDGRGNFGVVSRDEIESPAGADLVHWRHLNNKSLSMTVASRLRKKIYASDFGVTTATKPAFNLSVMQSMVDDSAAMGAAAVFDVSCSLSSGVILKSNCTVLIPRYVTIKSANGVDATILTQGATASLTNVYVEGGTLDGNQQNAPRAVAISVLDFGVCSNITIKGVTAKNGSGYGFAFQARPQTGISARLQGIAEDIVFDNCHAINNGIGMVGGTDTYDGFDIKYVEGCIFTDCSAVGNVDKGFDPRGDRVFMINCQAISNGSHGFGFSASMSDIGHPVKGSFLVSNLFADSNGASAFYLSEGVVANAVRYSFNATNLIGKRSGTHGFRVEAQNADVIASNVELSGTNNHGVYITSTSAASCNIAGLVIRDCDGSGIVVDVGATAPIQFSNIDVIAGAYGADVYSPEAVVFSGGRLSGISSGPMRINAGSAVPIMTGIVDGDITYKKGDVIANANAGLSLKLGMEKVIVSSTTTINNILPNIEGREVSIVSSGNVTYQSSSQMVLKTSPVTIADGGVIKFVAIGGKWRHI